MVFDGQVSIFTQANQEKLIPHGWDFEYYLFMYRGCDITPCSLLREHLPICALSQCSPLSRWCIYLHDPKDGCHAGAKLLQTRWLCLFQEWDYLLLGSCPLPSCYLKKSSTVCPTIESNTNLTQTQTKLLKMLGGAPHSHAATPTFANNKHLKRVLEKCDSKQ